LGPAESRNYHISEEVSTGIFIGGVLIWDMLNTEVLERQGRVSCLDYFFSPLAKVKSPVLLDNAAVFS
jgi:hypothetical protein